jgi:uncharacterized membrane protein YhaH (DUF805 family)
MNANRNEGSSAGLSLQSEQQPSQAIVCPKCQYKRTADDRGPNWQCPGCGVAYNKVSAAAAPAAAVHKVNSAPSARVTLEIDRDEPETVTPGAIGFSLQGRIGRLRYLAFSSLVMLLSAALGVMAAIINPVLKHPSTVLLILAGGVLGVLWLWMPLRLMALRMHDVNLSSKWLLALLLLPGVAAAVGGGPQVVLMCAGIFWVVVLVLSVVQGSEWDNDYGPPPGPNTAMVTVGAGLFIVLTVLGVLSPWMR